MSLSFVVVDTEQLSDFSPLVNISNLVLYGENIRVGRDLELDSVLEIGTDGLAWQVWEISIGRRCQARGVGRRRETRQSKHGGAAGHKVSARKVVGGLLEDSAWSSRAGRVLGKGSGVANHQGKAQEGAETIHGNLRVIEFYWFWKFTNKPRLCLERSDRKMIQ